MRTYTREQVEQVVAEICGTRRCEQGRWSSDSRHVQIGAREVLRRLDALPDADSGEGLPGECGNCGKPGAVCRPCRVELDICDMPDALSNPPAGPESSPTRSIAQGIADMTRHLPILPGVVPCDVKLAPRPRAATPTPEVPPYAKQDGTRRAELTRLHEGLDPLPTGVLASNEPTSEVPALKAEPHYRCADPDCEAPGRPEPTALAQLGHAFVPGDATYGWERQCAHPAKDGLRHCGYPPEAHAQPEPTAPEVVWTGDGVRVLADGTCQRQWADGGGKWEANRTETVTQLARALAEAKMEAAQHRVAGEAVRHAALNQSWAAAGGDVIAIHAALLASDTADAVHEAAESMRERVKEVLAELGFDLKPREVAVIDALPLEEP